MRDEKDTATLELIPAKRGRPCLDSEKGPMSAAEKQRRYRESKRKEVYFLRAVAGKERGFIAEQSDQDIVAAISLDLSFKQRAPSAAHHAKRRIAALVAELSSRYPQKK